MIVFVTVTVQIMCIDIYITSSGSEKLKIIYISKHSSKSNFLTSSRHSNYLKFLVIYGTLGVDSFCCDNGLICRVSLFYVVLAAAGVVYLFLFLH